MKFSCSFLALFLLVSAAAAQDLPPLPGPGLDIPVDIDGDGKSSWSKQFVLNFWLELGGDINKALEDISIGDEILMFGDFFYGPKAALSKDSPLNLASGKSQSGSGGGIALAENCQTDAELRPPFSFTVINPPPPQPQPPADPKQLMSILTNCHSLLDPASGHAFNNSGTFLFVAAAERITKVDLSGTTGQSLPLPAANVTEYKFLGIEAGAIDLVLHSAVNDFIGTNAGVTLVTPNVFRIDAVVPGNPCAEISNQNVIPWRIDILPGNFQTNPLGQAN